MSSYLPYNTEQDWSPAAASAPPQRQENSRRVYHPPVPSATAPPSWSGTRRDERVGGALSPFPISPSAYDRSGLPPRGGGGGGGDNNNNAVAAAATNKPVERLYFPAHHHHRDGIAHNTSQLTESDIGDSTIGASGEHESLAVYHLTLSPQHKNNDRVQQQANAAVAALNNTKTNHAEPDWDIRKPSPHHRLKLNQWYEKRFPVSLSMDDSKETRRHTVGESTVAGVDSGLSGGSGSVYSEDDDDGSSVTTGRQQALRRSGQAIFQDAERDYMKTKQDVAWGAIVLTAIELLVLMLQLALCGVATLDINPMVGPFPDAFSEWGGTNAYLMLAEHQWWRLITPSVLHVGILHLLANVICQLGSVALFEREWGTLRWTLLWLASSISCSAFSSYFDPDSIAVGSSGALMGLYSAKLAQVMTLTCFHVKKVNMDDVIRLDQLSGVLCGLLIVSMLSSFTYIEWSGHVGGLLAGFFGGMVLFSNPIASCCTRFLWILLGVVLLAGTIGCVLYDFVDKIEPLEDLADACNYFRSLFPEGYECGCMWNA